MHFILLIYDLSNINIDHSIRVLSKAHYFSIKNRIRKRAVFVGGSLL